MKIIQVHRLILSGGVYVFSGGNAVVGVLLLCIELLDVLWLSIREKESKIHVHVHMYFEERDITCSYGAPSVFIVVMTSSGEGFLSPWKDSS